MRVPRSSPKVHGFKCEGYIVPHAGARLIRTLVVSVPRSTFPNMLASSHCQHVPSVGYGECREQFPALTPS